MKKKLVTILLVLIFLLGLAILLYPSLSNYYNEMVGSYMVENYESKVSNSSMEQKSMVLNRAQDYNNELLNKATHFINGDPLDKNYLSQLKIEQDNNIIGTIKIDKIDLKLPIYNGTSQPILQKGVGHLEGSSLPIGGYSTHTILTGHTGLPSAKLFTDIDKLETGDIIVIQVLDRVLAYEVDYVEVVKPEEIYSLKINKDKDLLTLVTCTPYGVNSHRLLVHAQRIENIEMQVSNDNMEKGYILEISSILIIFVSILSSIIFKRKRKK